MTTQNIFELSKTKQVVALLNEKNMIFEDLVDVRTLSGLFTFFVSIQGYEVVDAHTLKVSISLSLDHEEDQIDYRTSSALVNVVDSTSQHSDVLRTVEEMSSLTSESQTLITEMIQHLEEKFTVLKLVSNTLYKSMSVDRDLKQIDNFLRRNSEQLYDYLKIDDYLESVTAREIIDIVIDEYYDEEIAREVDIELRPYVDPENDIDGKRSILIKNVRDFVTAEIVMGVDVLRLVSNMRHKIVNELLTHDTTYLSNLSDQQQSEILEMISSNSSVEDIFAQFDFDATSPKKHVLRMIHDKSFASRFDEFYKKYIDNKFYQNFLEEVRELGLKR